MNFYKKTIFIVLIIIFTFAVIIKLVEPVIEKQIKNIFADKKLSKKLNEELINSAKPLTEEKRKFYKTIFKKLYLKWAPIIKEVREEAELELKNK